MARARLARLRAQNSSEFTEPLLDYIPRVTPRWAKPQWLWPYAELLERAIREPIRAVVAAPPQHGKTETTIHALAWWFRKSPGRRHAYATYAQERSERVSNKTRLIAERDGMVIEGNQSLWGDASGSSILWTSIRGPFAGEPVDGVLLIDDPTKDSKDAHSAIRRYDQLEWFDSVAEPRCHPGASILVMSTRWHPEDLPGQLIARGWDYVNLKAIAEGQTDEDGVVTSDPLGRHAGEALCEARRPLADLQEKRKTNAYAFASLYQGEPRPREGTIFSDLPDHCYCEELPTVGYRVAYGVDLAYSAKKKADWSVVIRLYAVTPTPEREGDKPPTTYYVASVVRKQVDAPAFLLTLKAMHSEKRGPMLWIASGTEKGTAQFIQERVPLEVKNASEDKFQRALPVSEAWNAGRIMVPREAPWLDDFLDEVLNFTGISDAHDDQVDAFAAAFEAVATMASATRPSEEARKRMRAGGRFGSSSRGFG